jgi:hypothetical protein
MNATEAQIIKASWYVASFHFLAINKHHSILGVGADCHTLQLHWESKVAQTLECSSSGE